MFGHSPTKHLYGMRNPTEETRLVPYLLSLERLDDVGMQFEAALRHKLRGAEGIRVPFRRYQVVAAVDAPAAAVQINSKPSDFAGLVGKGGSRRSRVFGRGVCS